MENLEILKLNINKILKKECEIVFDENWNKYKIKKGKTITQSQVKRIINAITNEFGILAFPNKFMIVY